MKTKNMARASLALFSALTLTGCWAAVAGAGVGAEGGYIAAQDDRTAGETVTDQRITATVKTKLLADPDTHAMAINVDTFKSDVTLKGIVRTQHEANRVMEVARSVSGVNSVRSKMIVDPNR